MRRHFSFCIVFPPRLRRSHLNCSLLISLHNWVQQALHRRQALVWQVQYRSHCCRRKLFVCWFICHFPPKLTNQIAALNFQNRSPMTWSIPLKAARRAAFSGMLHVTGGAIFAKSTFIGRRPKSCKGMHFSGFTLRPYAYM